MHLRSAFFAAVLAGACAVVAAGASAEESPKPVAGDLSGHWRLNPALGSGDPASAAAAPSVPPEKKDDRTEKKDEPGPGQAGTELAITQTEPEIVVEEQPGAVRRRYYPNGRTYKADEGQSDIRSLWREGRLVFEKKSRQGWRLTETWQVAPDRSRLTVETRVEGGGRPKVAIKRVYDRVEPKP